MFQFGTIELSNVLTKEYREEVVTDPSGLVIQYVKHRLVVQGTLAKGLDPATTGESAANTLARLRQYLLRQRRYLKYAVGDDTVIEVGDSSSPNDPAKNVDAANGPLCLWVNATEITEGCIEVEVCIEAHVVPCSAGQKRSILSHTFSQNERYDKQGYCTLRTTGLIVCRSDLETSPTQLLEVSGLPKIRDGYERVGKSITLLEDGLRLSYEITDQEYHTRPPEGAVEFDSRSILITENGANGTYLDVMVRLKGFKETEKYNLYLRAARIIKSIVDPVRAQDKQGRPLNATRVVLTQMLSGSELSLETRVLVDRNRLVGPQNNGIPRSFFQYGDKTAAPDIPVPNNLGGQVREVRFVASPPEVVREGSRVEEIRDGQLVDLVRSKFRDPCDPLPPVRITRKKLNAGQVQLEVAGGPPIPQVVPPVQIVLPFGGPNPTPQPGQPNTPAVPNLQLPPGFPSIQIPPPIAVGANNPTAINAGAGQLGAQIGAFLGGGAGGLPNNQFNAFGGNPVAAGTLERLTSEGRELPDSPIPYTAYAVKVRWSYDSGKRVMEVASRHPEGGRWPNRVTSVHGGKLVMVVAWSAERVGDSPRIPDPMDGRDDYVLMTADMDMDEVQVTAGGNLRYRAFGVYTYGVTNYDKAAQFYPVPPFLDPALVAGVPANLEESFSPSLGQAGFWDQLKLMPPRSSLVGEVKPVRNAAEPFNPAPVAAGPAPAPAAPVELNPGR